VTHLRSLPHGILGEEGESVEDVRCLLAKSFVGGSLEEFGA
jgi:hypothetical protein